MTLLPSRLLFRSPVVGALLLAAACADSGSEPAPAAKPPTTIAIASGDNQSVGEMLPVPIPPAVRVTDDDGHGVPGVTVTFSAASGNGTITGGGRLTDADGIARVERWTLGPPGSHELRASVIGLAASNVTFRAMSTRRSAASVQITAQTTSLRPQETTTLAATPKDENGLTLSPRTATWASADTTRVHVSANGQATGVLPGGVAVRATIDGVTGQITINVTAPTIAAEFNGMSGHFSTNLDGSAGPPEGFGYGVSYYSAVFTLNESLAANTQLGWGSWIQPANRTFTQPLCPVGTIARDNWPERGPTYRDVYQNIEGGMGKWGSNAFPIARPKFRVNATPDCYNTQIASTGWTFNIDPLPANKLGLAQLSNRLLLPPDGLVFAVGAPTEFVGNAWIALPLIPAMTSPAGVPTGDQSWTLFVNAANYRGPIAFYTPETWSALNATDGTGIGRGHDARPAEMYQLAMEVGFTPTFTATDAGGVRYRRIPRLTFPVGQNGEGILVQEPRFYSKQAIWNAVAAWMENGPVATQFSAAGAYTPNVNLAPNASHMGVRLGGVNVTFDASFYMGAVAGPAGAGAFGMRWSGALEPGVMPEYYRESGTTWVPVPVTDVPRETWLVDQVFAPAPRRAPAAVNQNAGAPWQPSGWAAGPFTAALSDGSVVDYVWYRFVDQPAITRLGLSADARARLQALVESMHAAWGTQGPTMAPPTAVSLVSFDAGMLVTPPAGLERGFVPIPIRQR